MPTLRAAFFASISLVGTNALAQPAPPPPAPPPPAAAAAPGPAPAPAPVPPPPVGAAPEAPLPPPQPEVPPAALAEPPPPVAAPPEPAPAVEPEKPANPEKLSVGKNGGFWQPGGLLQFWAFYDHSEATKRSTARLRRAEIRIKGEIAPKIVAYQVMIDAAKTLNFGSGSTLTPPSDTSLLQDYFITFLSDYADVSLGQFKTQISLEGYTGSSKTILPERSLVSRAYGDRRDVGIRVEKKIGDYFSYSAGIYNGAGLNRVDNNNEKDVALRLEVYPIEGLTIAAAGAKTIGERDDELARDRVEGDIRYDANNFRAELEYIKAWDGVDNEEAGTTRLSGHGAYAAVGYTFIDRIQPVVRVGFVDGNVDDDDNETLKQYALGLNYLLRGNEMKLSLVGEYFSPEPPGAVGSEDMLELMLAAQVSF